MAIVMTTVIPPDRRKRLIRKPTRDQRMTIKKTRTRNRRTSRAARMKTKMNESDSKNKNNDNQKCYLNNGTEEATNTGADTEVING